MFAPDLLDALRNARRVVALTGAGASAESGIPTFREALTGLWARFDPSRLATPAAFLADPALVWGWYRSRRQRVRLAQPNAGHVALAALERRFADFTLITQNVDDLHERAGSRAPVHLHGNILAACCFDCRRPHALADETGPCDDEPVPPPRCGHCGGPVRPDVVWFGEALPAAALAQAFAAAAACDLLFSIGTSGVVYPAAELAPLAARHGATVVHIDPQETGLDDLADFALRGRAGELLPALLAAAWPEQISG